jgi:hypothetical protein
MTHIYMLEWADFDGYPIDVFASLEGAQAAIEGAVWKHTAAGVYPNGSEQEESWDYLPEQGSGGWVIKRWEVQP